MSDPKVGGTANIWRSERDLRFGYSYRELRTGRLGEWLGRRKYRVRRAKHKFRSFEYKGCGARERFRGVHTGIDPVRRKAVATRVNRQDNGARGGGWCTS